MDAASLTVTADATTDSLGVGGAMLMGFGGGGMASSAGIAGIVVIWFGSLRFAFCVALLLHHVLNISFACSGGWMLLVRLQWCNGVGSVRSFRE